MSTLGQKRRNHRVEDDDISSSSEHSKGMLVRTAQDMISFDFEVTERVPQRVNPVIAQRATEECVTREIFNCHPLRMTINELRLCDLEYRLPCGSRVIVPSLDDHAAVSVGALDQILNNI